MKEPETLPCELRCGRRGSLVPGLSWEHAGVRTRAPGLGLGANKWLFAGGLLVRAPEEPSLSSIVTEEDIQVYVQQFQKSGFR